MLISFIKDCRDILVMLQLSILSKRIENLLKIKTKRSTHT